MNGKSPEKMFDLSGGFKGLRERNELGTVYVAVVLGILLHWIWEVLVATLGSGQLDFGPWQIVIARIGIAFIVGLVSFIGIWKQLESVDPKIRFFVAVTQGFAVDALANPVVQVVL